ncbi:MAG: gluconate:H+ symporter [Pseudomonadota bacterium]
MELITTYQPAIATLISIIGLLILILRVRMNAFAALMLIAIFAAIAGGMTPDGAFTTISNGMGGVLGFIAPIIGLGALFGVILDAAGGIQALAKGADRFGSDRRKTWAMGGLGVLAATPVFFDVALLILLPFIAGLARKSGRPALYFGLPLCAGLAVGHAFIPPTPGPIAIAALLGAQLGWVILFGSLVGLITMGVGGPLLTQFLSKRGGIPTGTISLATLTAQSDTERVQSPLSFQTALALISLPLLLILSGTLASLMVPDGQLKEVLRLVGHPFSALLIASGACWWFAKRAGTDPEIIRDATQRAFEPTGVVILITGAGGAFKQVLVDTGAGEQIASLVLSIGFTPVLLAFILALIIRAAQGSATVAMITAAGLMTPIIGDWGLSDPQLAIITVSIAAGATGLSYVNDSGFWLVSRLFGLSEMETLRTWTLSTTLIAVTGLIVSLILYMFVSL